MPGIIHNFKLPSAKKVWQPLRNFVPEFDSLFKVLATIMFQEADELYELQIQEWDPVLKWFCKRYDVKLEAAREISGPTISQETKNVLTKHLLSYNFWAIHGRFNITFLS
jgi:hypothetical protein